VIGNLGGVVQSYVVEEQRYGPESAHHLLHLTTGNNVLGAVLSTERVMFNNVQVIH